MNKHICHNCYEVFEHNWPLIDKENNTVCCGECQEERDEYLSLLKTYEITIRVVAMPGFKVQHHKKRVRALNEEDVMIQYKPVGKIREVK